MTPANEGSVRSIESAGEDQLTVAHEQVETWAAMSTANTEEDFLRSHPNSANLV